MTSYQRERQALGQRLRELRLDARLTGLVLADKAGWHSSKISKIEAGKQTPSRDDLDAWARHCGAVTELPTLVAALHSLESHYQEHRRQFRAGLAGHQRDYAELEARTEVIRNFESAFIPGLLQTPDYARARLAEAVAHDGAPDDLDDAVSARMDRQHVLYQPGKKFHVVLTEAALRYRPCPVGVMVGQLDRLVAASTMRRLRLGVIPFTTPLPVVPVHGFWMFDTDLVRVETFTAELHITDSTELRSYARIFADLARAAVYGTLARTIITDVITSLDNAGEDAAPPP